MGNLKYEADACAVGSSAVTGIFIAWTAEAPIGNSLDMRPTGAGRAAATISTQATRRKLVRLSVTDASLRGGRLRGNNFWAKHRSREHKAQSSAAIDVDRRRYRKRNDDCNFVAQLERGCTSVLMSLLPFQRVDRFLNASTVQAHQSSVKIRQDAHC